MHANGTLKYGLRPTVRLANNMSPFSAIYTLKQDDREAHAKAIAQVAGSRAFADRVSELSLFHTFSISRINLNQILLQTTFDADVVACFEAFAAMDDALRTVLAHLHGAPDTDAPPAEMLEFLAAGQVDVIAYYCGYPELTVNRIRCRFGLGLGENRSLSVI